MTETVLLVDDEPNALAGYKRQLRKRFTVETAQSGAEALKRIDEGGRFAVVVSDMMMPEMNGVQLLGAVMERAPQTVRLMLTGNADQGTAMAAVNEGCVFRFLTKPIEPEDFAEAIQAALSQHRLVCAEKELLERTLAGSVKVLVDLLSLIDQRASGRGATLRRWAKALAGKLRVPQPWTVEMAAMLSRIGEVTLPPELRGPLGAGAEPSPLERDMRLRIPEISRDLIANIPRMAGVAEIVYYQDKRYDGGGFPDDTLSGDRIPAGARLLKILADVYAYSGGYEVTEAAFETLAKDVGAYDPKLLRTVAKHRALLQAERESGDGSVVESTAAGLEVGDRLATDLTTAAGDLVLTAGHELTGALIERLRNLVRLKHLSDPIRVLRAAAPARAAE